MNNQTLYGLCFFVALFLIGVIQALKRIKYLKYGIKVDAEVVDIVPLKGIKRHYLPVVSYKTLEGTEVIQRADEGAYPPMFVKNEKIQIIYQAEDVRKFIICNGKLSWINIACILMGFIGVLVISIT